MFLRFGGGDLAVAWLCFMRWFLSVVGFAAWVCCLVLGFGVC